VYRCSDCKMEFPATPRTHNCSQSAENVAVRKAEDEAWHRRHDFVAAQWEAWLEKKGMTDEPGAPLVGVLPTVQAFEGRCVIFAPKWDDEFNLYHTDILRFPTWGLVYQKFVQSMAITGDTYHSSLKGIQPITEPPNQLRNLPDDVTVLEFCTGS